MLKTIGFNLILFLALIVFANFFVNTISYFDAPRLCYIAIDNDILKGNQKTIREAIKLIKIDSEESYQTLCAYVDTIVEQECVNFDPRVTKKNLPPPSACYIKGSKVIYLPSESNESEAIIRERAEMIKKYSKQSQEFWEAIYLR
jgi:hypothetical protein